MPEPISAQQRWLLLSAYWLAQAVFLWSAYVFTAATFGDKGVDLAPPADYLRMMFDPEVLGLMAVWIPVLTGLQMLFLLPLRLAPRRARRGRSLYVSLGAGAMLLALVVVGFFAALTELVVLYDLAEPRGWSWPAMLAGLAASWLVFTALLVRYVRRSSLDREGVVTRVAQVVFAGTAVETAALIPIDIMVRRKTDCYCWSGSFYALILSGAVGVVVAGPAVFLPLFMRRRRRLFRGRCAGCGYDRAGLAPETACPECGTTGEGEGE